MHPIFVFVAVIAGGELAGILGVVFAIPALAVLRVLLDFFRARLRMVDRRQLVSAAAARPAEGMPVSSLPPLPPPVSIWLDETLLAPVPHARWC